MTTAQLLVKVRAYSNQPEAQVAEAIRTWKAENIKRPGSLEMRDLVAALREIFK